MISNNENPEKIKEPPLRISESERKFGINQKSKPFNDLGYNFEQLKVLKILEQFKDDIGTKFIIISCKDRHSQDEFLNCLKVKLKKSGIFANGIISEDESKKKEIEKNVCASTMNASILRKQKKSIIEEEIMIILKDKSKEEIADEI